jgi:hypothetical protein
MAGWRVKAIAELKKSALKRTREGEMHCIDLLTKHGGGRKK